ncbi:hypothetical protein PHLGIDRAFT_377911 [Phlebiopsis gigantea 11061_1 CR5-6]|uniref:Uncharacterized protein n=1 Tax=Phlebiopsis gigantea (strain 11061_1 CR5-6) TaxID=745531 RepID=A0A0C3NT91_PHLG1|nr:hypothetical protein PHLGIDRAFT_377911 [Phlebiopsis gigantea 11061_1 CR5-6]
MLVHLLLRGRNQGRIYVQKKYRELKRAFAPSQALTLRHHALIAYRGVAGHLMTLPTLAYWFGALLVYFGARRALLMG